MKVSTRLLALALFATSILFFQNCAKINFSEDLASLNKNNCRIDAVNRDRDIKVLFVVDTSGSNANNDNGKTWRLKTINSFINKYSQNNFYYAFATFAGSNSMAYNVIGGFSNVRSVINSDVQKLSAVNDTGGTPYQAAMRSAEVVIKDEETQRGGKASYVVVLISDGEPTDTRYTKDSNSQNLTEDVQKVLSSAPEKTTLNTVFYTALSASKENTSYLQKMAEVGGGSFMRAKTDSVFDLNSSIYVVGDCVK
ncbi:von Willebrand factor type A domain protein [compost metagenome]